ncbi:MAG: ABC transporter ATP-binding protein [Theionarchaea archaeon]|nr:ABC transporter ATP-binding protein [Theionarchaea archaeon]
MIEIQHLTKEYTGVRALDKLSLTIQKGEFFGLLGPNGAGKTTTIRLLTGLAHPTSGSILVDGVDIVENPSHITHMSGVVFENQNAYDDMTVWQNLRLFARIYNIKDDRIEELMNQMDLGPHKKKKAKHLSKGLKQRLLIARALLHDPEILFLDEPTEGLDPLFAKSIRSLITDLNEMGKTILLTTHYMEEAEQLCDRVAIINQGALVELSDIQSLKDKYIDEYQVKIRSSDQQIADLLKEYPVQVGKNEYRVRIKKSEASTILKLVAEKGTMESVEELFMSKPSLEAIYIKLIGGDGGAD